MKVTITGIAFCAFATAALADDQPPQPVFSEPFTAPDALAAFAEIEARRQVAEAEQQARFSAFEGDMADFVRSDPILQRVTWPFENCTDVASLIPPPEG
ncbi:MAG: hypothetical protein AAGF56_09915 [Pseudomonadota bacterium]